jgi:hypothetical protein
MASDERMYCFPNLGTLDAEEEWGVEMPQEEGKNLERILALTTTLELSCNDVRILINALNALVYFGKVDNEDYIDSDGLELRARLQRLYSELLQKESFGTY